MMSKIMLNREPGNLSFFLPSNLISKLDESNNISSKNTHKESNVSKFINN